MIPLDTPLQFLKGVGPRRAADLQRVGLATVEDLLYRFPIRYEDRGTFQTIASLKPGVAASVVGEVVSSGIRPTRRAHFRIFEMLVRDATASLRVIFFNQPYLKDVFHPHQRVILFGKLELTSHGLQLQNPQYEILRQDADAEGAPGPAEDETLHTGRIVPIYEKTGTLTPKMQRAIVHQALSQLPADVPDPLPDEVLRRQQLIDRRTALMDVHFPPAGTPVEQLNGFRSAAQRRLIFEEFFLFQIGLVLRRRKSDAERKPRSVVVTDEIRESARRVLPFKLTGDQKKVIGEIVTDMKRPQPMNRLLQGDVGSGKTIVALMAALVAMENGFQVAFMAPTEILAEQHFITIRTLLEASRFRIALLTGATPAKRRREVQAELSGGSIHLAVGTHALVQDPVGFRELGLVDHRRAAPLRRAPARDAARQGAAPRRAGDDRHADPAHAGPDDLWRSRRVDHARDAARTVSDQDHREAGIAPGGDLRVHPEADRRGPAGLRDLPARRGVRKGGPEGGHRDGGPPRAGRVSQLSRGAPARPPEAGRQGARDGGLRARRVRHPRLDDRRRSRRGRFERRGHARGARRAVRPLAAPPAPGPRRPRSAPVGTACSSISIR